MSTAIIVALSAAILFLLIKKRPALARAGSQFYIARVEWPGITIEGVLTTVNLRDDQKVKATVAFVDAKGVPAEIQPGSVVWSTSDTNIASVTADSNDEKSAEIVAGTPSPANADGSPGPAAVIQVAAKDADQNDIVAQGTINVVAGDAKVGSLTFGAPENQ